MAYTDILRIVPTVQAINLASRNLPKKKKKNLVKQGVENVVGTVLIKDTVKFIYS